jgi:NAD(P)-dependent dehydrogenase (short-subunit alcohol dehydrogenase family)
MKSQSGGVILNCGSYAGLIPPVGAGAYGAFKAGVHNLSKSLAAELAPYNIRVNTYIPGAIYTEMTSSTGRKVEELAKTKLFKKARNM